MFCKVARLLLGLVLGAAAAPAPVFAAPAAPSDPAIQISAGNRHTCLVTAAANAWCWGKESSGQLGIGPITQVYFSGPMSVAMPAGTAEQIAAGGNHTCAVQYVPGSCVGSICAVPKHKAVCWGANGEGAVGAWPLLADVDTPTDVMNASFSGYVSPITQMAAGGGLISDDSCYIRDTGALMCFGRNLDYELGIGYVDTTHVTPTQVFLGALSVLTVSIGTYHSCGIGENNFGRSVWCWGKNAFGEVGVSVVTQPHYPYHISALDGASAVAAGHDHSCAVLSGAVWCWGLNDQGQLGLGYTDLVEHPDPQLVVGLAAKTAIALAAGLKSSCALFSDGTMACWGSSVFGQAGDGSYGTSSNYPSFGNALTGVTQIAMGAYHVCALLNSGAVKCWGLNDYGQVGNLTRTDSAYPVDVFRFEGGPLVPPLRQVFIPLTMRQASAIW